METLKFIINNWLKFFFLVTPFFVLSMFLSMTSTWQERERKKLALKITFSAFCTSLVIFFAGNVLFDIFGITLDSFRIGGGAMLFLSAISLMNGAAAQSRRAERPDADIAVVPLAIPVTVGPATTGVLLISGAETPGMAIKLLTCVSLAMAFLSVGLILYGAAAVERVLSRRGIVILSKLTGLILAALASQMIFTGIINFLKLIK